MTGSSLLGSQAAGGGPPPSPTTYIIDTSVAIKWYLPEIYQTEAQRFLDPVYDRHAPDLIHAELGSVLLKKIRRGEFTADKGRQYLGQLVATPLPLMTQETLPIRPAALEIAMQIGSLFYDGLFLALAMQLGGRLVTADDKLYKKVQGGPFNPWALWVADPL
jgi:predicted nucleic acid-binding protein